MEKSSPEKVLSLVYKALDLAEKAVGLAEKSTDEVKEKSLELAGQVVDLVGKAVHLAANPTQATKTDKITIEVPLEIKVCLAANPTQEKSVSEPKSVVFESAYASQTSPVFHDAAAPEITERIIGSEALRIVGEIPPYDDVPDQEDDWIKP